jgi:hypothetical protein
MVNDWEEEKSIVKWVGEEWEKSGDWLVTVSESIQRYLSLAPSNLPLGSLGAIEMTNALPLCRPSISGVENNILGHDLANRRLICFVATGVGRIKADCRT